MAVQPQEAVRPLSVLELNSRIHDLLATRFQSVMVKGEVSGVSVSRGHVWFTLKDPAAAVEAVIFSSTARRLPLLPENGQELVVTCQVDYHAQTGRLKLVVNRVDYDGIGKLREAIEQLKRRLQAEGAFDPTRKRALPFLPRCVALITSPSGAVIHDLQQTIWERFPNMRLVVYPAQVQGMASQRSLVSALRQCDRDALADVCIVARGGGSFEELMAFNQEAVVRAIQSAHIPVVTALGHTSDRTLADLVADREARTPTAAAELVVPRKADLLLQLKERRDRLRRGAHLLLLTREQALTLRRAKAPVLQNPVGLVLAPALDAITRRAQELERLGRDALVGRRAQLQQVGRMLRQLSPREILSRRQGAFVERTGRFERVLGQLRRRRYQDAERVAALRERLRAVMDRAMREQQRVLDGRGQRLRSLGPEETLERGYSICIDASRGRVLRDAKESSRGQGVRVMLAKGRLECTVDDAVP